MKNKGFTLVEMMAVVCISMIIFAAIFGLFLMGRNSWLIGKTYVELQQKTRTAMEKIIGELSRSASSVAMITSCQAGECSGNKVTFEVPTITAAPVANTIFNAQGNIKWGADGYLAGEIMYMALPNKKLIRRVDFTPPTGACCFSNGSCVEGTQISCSSLTGGGTYQGDGTSCAMVNCPQQPPCFLASTPILMADGSTRPIEKVRAGDQIMAFDEEAKNLVKDRVKEFFVHTADNYLVINNRLRVTPNHPVYSQGKWVEIGTLKPGDFLFNSRGRAEIIKAIKPIQKKVKVYNLEVNPYHNYFAGGILAHNKEPGVEYMQGDWSKLFQGLFSPEEAFANQVDQIIATDIESITFTGYPNNSNPERITILIRARKMTFIQRDIDITISSSIQLRN